MHTDLIVARPEGMYCPPGDFYIDPWRPVHRAIITHAHADHARVGHGEYLSSSSGEAVLRARLGEIKLQTLDHGHSLRIGDTRVSLHPAGHVLGSVQVRVEHHGNIWVASGDYKTAPDPTCLPFEPVRCHTFISESTFGLPIYRWDEPSLTMQGIAQWWQQNAALGRASVLFCYAFGKAQRVLASLAALHDAYPGPIICHGAVEGLNDAYRRSGVHLPPTMRPADIDDASLFRRALIVAPPSAAGTPWLKRFGTYSDAFASGWMRLRGARRRRGVDRGFILSDHADWPGLNDAVAATGASRIVVTHGQVAPLIRYLSEQGLEAGTLRKFRSHADGIDEDAPSGDDGEAGALTQFNEAGDDDTALAATDSA